MGKDNDLDKVAAELQKATDEQNQFFAGLINILQEATSTQTLAWFLGDAPKSFWSEEFDFGQLPGKPPVSELHSWKPTITHLAFFYAKNEQILEYIVEKAGPASLEARDEQGRTPLMYAAMAGNVEAIQWVAKRAVKSEKEASHSPDGSSAVLNSSFDQNDNHLTSAQLSSPPVSPIKKAVNKYASAFFKTDNDDNNLLSFGRKYGHEEVETYLKFVPVQDSNVSTELFSKWAYAKEEAKAFTNKAGAAIAKEEAKAPTSKAGAVRRKLESQGTVILKDEDLEHLMGFKKKELKTLSERDSAGNNALHYLFLNSNIDLDALHKLLAKDGAKEAILAKNDVGFSPIFQAIKMAGGSKSTDVTVGTALALLVAQLDKDALIKVFEEVVSRTKAEDPYGTLDKEKYSQRRDALIGAVQKALNLKKAAKSLDQHIQSVEKTLFLSQPVQEAPASINNNVEQEEEMGGLPVFSARGSIVSPQPPEESSPVVPAPTTSEKKGLRTRADGMKPEEIERNKAAIEEAKKEAVITTWRNANAFDALDDASTLSLSKSQLGELVRDGLKSGSFSNLKLVLPLINDEQFKVLGEYLLLETITPVATVSNRPIEALFNELLDHPFVTNERIKAWAPKLIKKIEETKNLWCLEKLLSHQGLDESYQSVLLKPFVDALNEQISALTKDQQVNTHINGIINVLMMKKVEISGVSLLEYLAFQGNYAFFTRIKTIFPSAIKNLPQDVQMRIQAKLFEDYQTMLILPENKITDDNVGKLFAAALERKCYLTVNMLADSGQRILGMYYHPRLHINEDQKAHISIQLLKDKRADLIEKLGLTEYVHNQYGTNDEITRLLDALPNTKRHIQGVSAELNALSLSLDQSSTQETSKKVTSHNADEVKRLTQVLINVMRHKEDAEHVTERLNGALELLKNATDAKDQQQKARAFIEICEEKINGTKKDKAGENRKELIQANHGYTLAQYDKALSRLKATFDVFFTAEEVGQKKAKEPEEKTGLLAKGKELFASLMPNRKPEESISQKPEATPVSTPASDDSKERRRKDVMELLKGQAVRVGPTAPQKVQPALQKSVPVVPSTAEKTMLPTTSTSAPAVLPASSFKGWEKALSEPSRPVLSRANTTYNDSDFIAAAQAAKDAVNKAPEVVSVPAPEVVASPTQSPTQGKTLQSRQTVFWPEGMPAFIPQEGEASQLTASTTNVSPSTPGNSASEAEKSDTEKLVGSNESPKSSSGVDSENASIASGKSSRSNSTGSIPDVEVNADSNTDENTEQPVLTPVASIVETELLDPTDVPADEAQPAAAHVVEAVAVPEARPTEEPVPSTPAAAEVTTTPAPAASVAIDPVEPAKADPTLPAASASVMSSWNRVAASNPSPMTATSIRLGGAKEVTVNVSTPPAVNISASSVPATPVTPAQQALVAQAKPAAVPQAKGADTSTSQPVVNTLASSLSGQPKPQPGTGATPLAIPQPLSVKPATPPAPGIPSTPGKPNPVDGKDAARKLQEKYNYVASHMWESVVIDADHVSIRNTIKEGASQTKRSRPLIAFGANVEHGSVAPVSGAGAAIPTIRVTHLFEGSLLENAVKESAVKYDPVTREVQGECHVLGWKIYPQNPGEPGLTLIPTNVEKPWVVLTETMHKVANEGRVFSVLMRINGVEREVHAGDIDPATGKPVYTFFNAKLQGRHSCEKLWEIKQRGFEIAKIIDGMAADPSVYEQLKTSKDAPLLEEFTKLQTPALFKNALQQYTTDEGKKLKSEHMLKYEGGEPNQAVRKQIKKWAEDAVAKNETPDVYVKRLLKEKAQTSGQTHGGKPGSTINV